MNDWDIMSFLVIIFSIQLIMWGTIGFDMLGLKIPILRQFVAFIYLNFIPGILILRVLNLHNLGNIKTILFSMGSSLAMLIFTGFSINIIYPQIGIPNPLSTFCLMITISMEILLLCALCYIVDKNYSNPSMLETQDIFSLQSLTLFFIPFLSIFGTYFVNYAHNNILLMLLMMVISVLTILVGLDKFISEKWYPFTIWIFSISLILHTTLISSYVNVGDVVNEYYYADKVIKNLYWNWNLFGTYNSVLSTVILAPIYYHILNLELTWIFKFVYPFLFSFVSLGVYTIFFNGTKNSKISFFSSFLFISILPFMFQIPLITKQSTSEIFLSLLLILIFNNNIEKTRKAFLSIIFVISLSVSHYGTSYLFMFSLIFVFVLLYVINIKQIQELFGNIYFKLLHKEGSLYTHLPIKCDISPNFALLTFIFTVAWYAYISDASSLRMLVHIGKHISDTIYTDFLSSDTSRGLYMIMRGESSFLRMINKIMYLIVQFLILIGFTKNLHDYNKLKLSRTYIGFSIYFLIILFAAIAISGFSVMDPRRLFHLSLFLLSPFAITGFSVVFTKIVSMNLFSYGFKLEYLAPTLSVFLVIFFLFNVGFFFEIVNDHPNSISISQETSIKSENIEDKARFYGNYIVTQNVFSGKWLGANLKKGSIVYRGDLIQGYPSLTIYGGVDSNSIRKFDNTTENLDVGFVQLSYLNIVEKTGSTWYNELQIRTAYHFEDVYFLLKNKNKIYDNGGSQVLMS